MVGGVGLSLMSLDSVRDSSGSRHGGPIPRLLASISGQCGMMSRFVIVHVGTSSGGSRRDRSLKHHDGAPGPWLW